MRKPGFKHTEITKRRIAKSHIGIRPSIETRKKLSESHKGKKQSQETISKRIKKGTDHYNWKGGISKEGYPYKFDLTLKNLIRKRDGFKCQICGCPQVECDQALIVHHIDYNKNNLDFGNLISLCRICHIKTNYSRKFWEVFFSCGLYKKEVLDELHC